MDEIVILIVGDFDSMNHIVLCHFDELKIIHETHIIYFPLQYPFFSNREDDY